MKFRWRRVVGLGGGLKASIGKKGIGLGMKIPGIPAHIGVRPDHTPYMSVGIPNTGLYVSHDLTTKNTTQLDNNQQQLVYFIQDGDAVKIGRSNDPEARRGELQIGNPRTLTLLATAPGGKPFEDWLQKTFDHLWLRGEWYALDNKLLYVIGKYGQLFQNRDET